MPDEFEDGDCSKCNPPVTSQLWNGTVANINYLTGIRCPKCGSLAPFNIGPVGDTLIVDDNDIEPIRPTGWTDETDISCRKCEHTGVVGDFRTGSQHHRTTIEIGGSVDVVVNYTGGDVNVWRAAVADAFARLTEDQIADVVTLRGHGPAPLQNDIQDDIQDDIQAEVHTGDLMVKVEFNAVAWFEFALPQSIVALAKCGWGGNYAISHTVAMHMTDHNEDVKRMFTYLSIAKDVGYECHVNEESAMAWLKEHRPEIHEVIKREEADNG